jgi:hypothetical protein
MSGPYNIDKILGSSDVSGDLKPSIDLRFRIAFSNVGEITSTIAIDTETGVKTFQYTIPTGQGEKSFVCHQRRDGTTTVVGTDAEDRPIVAVVKPNKEQSGGVTVTANGDEIVYDAEGNDVTKKAPKKSKPKKLLKRSNKFRLPREKKIVIPKLFGDKKLLSKIKLKVKKDDPDSNLFGSALAAVKSNKKVLGEVSTPDDGLLTGAKLVLHSTSDSGAIGDSSNEGSGVGRAMKSRSAGSKGVAGGEIDGETPAPVLSVSVTRDKTQLEDELGSSDEIILTLSHSRSTDGAVLMVSGKDSDSSSPTVRPDDSAHSASEDAFDSAVAVVETSSRDGWGSSRSTKKSKLKFGIEIDLDGGQKATDAVPSGIEAAQLAADKVVMPQKGLAIATTSKVKVQSRNVVRALFDSEQTGDGQKDGKSGGHGEDDGQSEEQFA